jgi:hypothetical protein
MPLARMVVNQADNDVPHDRAPLLIQLIGAHLGFRPASSAVKNGFVGFCMRACTSQVIPTGPNLHTTSSATTIGVHATGSTEDFVSALKGRPSPAVMLFNFSTIGNRRVGTQMRIPLVGCVLLAAIQPSFAQKLLTTEPLILDPYVVVFVNDGSCSEGKILKVTGAIRGLRRKKFCVPAASKVSES